MLLWDPTNQHYAATACPAGLRDRNPQSLHGLTGTKTAFRKAWTKYYGELTAYGESLWACCRLQETIKQLHPGWASWTSLHLLRMSGASGDLLWKVGFTFGSNLSETVSRYYRTYTKPHNVMLVGTEVVYCLESHWRAQSLERRLHHLMRLHWPHLNVAFGKNSVSCRCTRDLRKVAGRRHCV